ncbi:MAG TPA: hypothetical protein VMC85_20805 [Desulfomonilaceae bacterium]|nr:hypothetical protein [Desulfomonilaceae bacterium]
MADEQKGLKGFSKMGSKYESKPAPKKEEAPQGGDETGVKTHTVEEHPDGHFESHMHDGTHSEHPDHMHLLTHMGHHLSGGDKHHMVHHDGMSARSHSIHEDGQHEEHGEHNSAEDAKMALDKFLGEEASEPAHQQQPEPEHEGAYGAM